MKTIGILGGMGPEATAQLYLEIIKIFQEEYGAKYDDDFPQIVILNLPLPDVVEEKGSMEAIVKTLQAGVKKLEQAGVDFIAIPCNTAMNFLPQMKEITSVPFLNVVVETADFIKEMRITTVGIIATEMTLRKNLYGSSLEGVDLIIPRVEQQKAVTQVILNILCGKKEIADRKFLQELITELKEKGAKKVILGCTELPLLIRTEDTLDTIKILAKAVVRDATREETK